MAGMYPDNQNIEVFGEQVPWPGVDADGKFTNGSFSDPLVKPSFIPAGTINLILDNLAALITEMGGIPNNTDTNQLVNSLTAALALKAPLASPALTGTPTAPTAGSGTNNTQIATTAFVMAAIAALVNSSPAALDTLSELAAALGNDPNFATTIINALALKAPLASPALTGAPTAPTAGSGTNNTQIATTAFVMAAITQPVPPDATTDKTLLGEATGGQSIELSFAKGWYYVELQGGGGGKAGNYHNVSGEGTNYYGSYGKSGDTISTPFFLPYDTKIILQSGSVGYNGGSLGSYATSGLKGSPSYLLVPQYGLFIYVNGGNGGNGYSTNNNNTGDPPLASYARIYRKN